MKHETRIGFLTFFVWASACFCLQAQTVSIKTQKNISDNMNVSEDLKTMRMKIDSLDNELLDILAKRMKICIEVGKYKKEHGVAVVQSNRYKEILEDRSKKGREKGLDETFTKQIMHLIHDESVRQQTELTGK